MSELKKQLSEYKNVYFVGIGGVSMSALALILRSKGVNVSGYDRSHSHETEILENAGVGIIYSEASPIPEGVDLCVYTAAVNTSHPIVAKAIAAGIECVTRAILLGAIAECYDVSVGVAGTHGKSTTSGMISRIYSASPDYDPSFAVGALLPFVNAYYQVGTDGNFIFEADEYKDSFLHFRPTTAVVLNVCHDHPDYFKDLAHTVRSFSQYVSNSDKAVFGLDSEGAVMVAESYKKEKYFFSDSQKTDFYATDVITEGGFAKYNLHYPDGVIEIVLSVAGRHNVLNSLAAFAACYINGMAPDIIAAGIKAFHGVSRRFETVGRVNDAVLISDYAHHPDEIRVCLNTAKEMTKGKVITVFQPHTYSRLKGLFDEFISSLSISDICAVTDVFSARETDTCGVSGELLASRLNGAYIPSFESGADFIRKNAKENDTVIIMGAGDIYKIGDILQKNS